MIWFLVLKLLLGNLDQLVYCSARLVLSIRFEVGGYLGKAPAVKNGKQFPPRQPISSIQNKLASNGVFCVKLR